MLLIQCSMVGVETDM